MFKKFEIISTWARKLFRINSSSEYQIGRKKFSIQKEIQMPPPPKNTGLFANITETRPKQCPYCKTNKLANITRITGVEKWQCKKCRYKW